MTMRINVRPLVQELLENENIIVNYKELDNGGFDLSVRIDEEKLQREKDYHLIMALEQKEEKEDQ